MLNQYFGYLSGVAISLSFVPYLISIFKKETKPERASWLIWAVLGGISFFSQSAKGASDSLWLTGVQTFGDLTIFLFAIKYGIGGLLKRDILALCGAGLSLILWYLTSEPAIALIIVIFIDALGGVLTIIKSYEYPGTESISAWVLTILGGLFGALAVGRWNLTLLAFPVYISLISLIILLAAFFGLKNKTKKQSKKIMNYKAIGFDYGGVVAGPTGAKLREVICELFNITAEEFRAVYFKHNTVLNDGDMTYDELWTIFAKEIGQPEKTEDLLKLIAEWPMHRKNEDILELAKKLKNAGYKIGMLSNNNFANKEIMLKGGLDKIFDPLVISSEIKASKPWPEAYKIFAEKMGCQPEEIIFIDDSPKNVAVARELGFAGIVFKDYSSLIAELAAFGIKIQ